MKKINRTCLWKEAWLEYLDTSSFLEKDVGDLVLFSSGNCVILAETLVSEPRLAIKDMVAVGLGWVWASYSFKGDACPSSHLRGDSMVLEGIRDYNTAFQDIQFLMISNHKKVKIICAIRRQKILFVLIRYKIILCDLTYILCLTWLYEYIAILSTNGRKHLLKPNMQQVNLFL